MSTPSPANDLHEQIRQEHEDLRKLLGDVHRILVEQSATGENVAEVFTSLCQQIAAHFSDEEEGGFFTEIIGSSPRLKDQVASLKEDHEELTKQLNHLCQLAGAGDNTPTWWQKMDSAFHDFSKALMHPENQESSLLLDAC